MSAFVTITAPEQNRLEFQRLRLSVADGPDAGTSVDLADGRVRVGTREGNELTLTDDQVSGLHLEIAVEREGVRLRDRGSTNGTVVSGLRVHDIYLVPGVEVRLGRTGLRLEALAGRQAVELPSENHFGPLVGRSVRMRQIFGRLEKIAKADVTLLITGETGTGKEVVAQATHNGSSRSYDPFIAVDCSSLPSNLIESELFGHERGAFTGADRTFPGAFERAGAGTVFLDELGELPLSLQPKLLRALDRCEFRRLGSETVRPIRARFLAATNRDLIEMVNEGTFRDDLYYRLAVAEVHIPPLRERRDDIPLLGQHFFDQLTGDGQQLDAETIQALVKHSWPGNVRELRNAIQRVALLDEEPVSQAHARTAETGPGSPLSVRFDISYKEARDLLLAEFQALYTKEMLDRSGGAVAAAARLAGVDRMTFYRLMKKAAGDED